MRVEKNPKHLHIESIVTSNDSAPYRTTAGENLANSRFQSKMANWFHFVSTILPFASGEAHSRLPLNLNIHKSLLGHRHLDIFCLNN